MIKKLFRQMLLAQIISAMTVMICMLIDSIMIGRFLGVDAMTAYGLASPVLMVFAAIGSMLTAGIQVKCGQTTASGDADGTNSCFSVSVATALVVSSVGVALVFAFTPQIATLLGAGSPSPDNEVFRLTCDYLRGFIIGAPAFMFAQTMVPFMQISGNRIRLIAAVGAMTVSDVVFDIVNVSLVRGGMFGMGLASSLSYYIAFLVGVIYFFKKDCMFKFSFSLLKKRTFGAIIAGGVPTVVNQICLVLMVYVFNQILLSVGGNSSVAAYSVISTVGNLCYSFCFGVGSVTLMLSSIFYSDEDSASLKALVKTMAYFAVVLDAAVMAVTFLVARPMVGLFLADNAYAAEMAAKGLRLFSLSLVPSALNSAFKNYYQGISRVQLTHVISVLQSFVFPASFAFVLSRFVGTDGVWLAYVCGECATLIAISAVVFAKQKKFSLSASCYAMLPAGFGSAEGESLEVTVKTMDEAIEASERARGFCREHGESAKNCSLIALCIEEMAGNVIEHGFVKDKKKDHSIDIRLLFKKNGKRVIRMRDNCVNFDPVKYLELHRTDDPTAHIGIRMVMAMTKEANYVNSLGLNNLTLVI